MLKPSKNQKTNGMLGGTQAHALQAWLDHIACMIARYHVRHRTGAIEKRQQKKRDYRTGAK